MSNLSLFPVMPKINSAKECEEIVCGYVLELVDAGYSAIPSVAIWERFRREYLPPDNVRSESGWLTQKLVNVANTICDHIRPNMVFCPLSAYGVKRIVSGRAVDFAALKSTDLEPEMARMLPLGAGKHTDGILICDADESAPWMDDLVRHYYHRRCNSEQQRFNTVVTKLKSKVEKLQLASGANFPMLAAGGE